VARVLGGKLVISETGGSGRVVVFEPNKFGLINVAELSKYRGANFKSIQSSGREENFLGVQQAAALFNVAAAYRKKYPKDQPLVFTGGSTNDGTSAAGADGKPIHKYSHKHGANIDLRHMGSNGVALQGKSAAKLGDKARNRFIIQEFARQDAGLGAAITGDQARYRLPAVSRNLECAHRDHLHFQRTRPASAKRGARSPSGQVNPRERRLAK
jgi:hypothetical protein